MEVSINKLRDPISGLTHLFAAFAALIGTWALFGLERGNRASVGFEKEVSLLIYGLSLILMFSASAAYHLIKAGPEAMLRLRKLDHSAIYFLIAGSYTPICLSFFGGFWRWGLLGIIWLLALVGVIVKMYVIHAPRWLTAGIYLMMGWLSILAVQEILKTMPVGAIVWLVLGGLFFSLGAVVYIRKAPDFFPRVFGFHEIWHIFVILGCMSHFILVAAYIAPF